MDILNKDKLKQILQKWKGHPSITDLMDRFDNLQVYTKKKLEKQKTLESVEEENSGEQEQSSENSTTESSTEVVNSLEEADPWLKQKEESFTRIKIFAVHILISKI